MRLSDSRQSIGLARAVPQWPELDESTVTVGREEEKREQEREKERATSEGEREREREKWAKLAIW